MMKTRQRPAAARDKLDSPTVTTSRSMRPLKAKGGR
jgi:hypothetical protein